MRKRSGRTSATQVTGALPSALGDFGDLVYAFRGRRPALFLNFDGTLAPITDRPDAVQLAAGTRWRLKKLATLMPVAIVSGRDADDVRRKVRVRGLWYAGSHGLDILPPGSGTHIQHGLEQRPKLGASEHLLKQQLADFHGVLIEPKRLSLAIHYRLVAPDAVPRLREAVEAVARQFGLRLERGKQVLDLRPDVAWDKGHAIGWIAEKMGLDAEHAALVFVGDDTTDEGAFREVTAEGGIGILVSRYPRSTVAGFLLAGPGQVGVFLDRLIAWFESGP